MTKVHFYRYIPYETGFMGNFDLSEYEIPINIFVDNAEDFPDLKECDAEMDIYGIAQGFKLFKSEAEYEAAGTNMAVQSMIPSGTFSVLSEDKKFAPSPEIVYNGIVKCAGEPAQLLPRNRDLRHDLPSFRTHPRRSLRRRHRFRRRLAVRGYRSGRVSSIIKTT